MSLRMGLFVGALLFAASARAVDPACPPLLQILGHSYPSPAARIEHVADMPPGEHAFLAYGADGNETGAIMFTELQDGGIYLDRVSSTVKGTATALYAEALKAVPNAKYIKGVLEQDNLAAFKAALKSGLTPLEALQKTPAYRARARAGFTVIDMALSKITDDTVTLVTRRPN